MVQGIIISKFLQKLLAHPAFKAVANGTVRAEAKVLRCGSNLAVVDCDVRDVRGMLVAKALLTFSIAPTKRM